MIRFLGFLIVFFLAARLAPAAGNAPSLESAAAAYNAGNFEESRRLLRELHESGHHAPESWLLDGHAAARMDNTPESILAYRRALVLDPSLPEARQNLEVLTTRNGIPEAPAPPPLVGWLDRIPRSWFWLAGSAGLWLAVAGGMGLLMSQAKAAFLPSVIAVSLGGGTMLAATSAAVALWRAENFPSTAAGARLWRPDAQLMKSTALQSAPARRASEIIGSVPAGTAIRMVDEAGWAYVEVPGGAGSPPLRGWIEPGSWLPLWPGDRSLLRRDWP